MPTKRTRITRKGRIPSRVRAILGIGMSINTLPPDELRAMWGEWGAAVCADFERRYGPDGRRPFVERIAKREGW
jgi:hypothetical protein